MIKSANMKKLIVGSIFIILFLSSCDKENNDNNVSEKLVFNSLTAENDSIHPGESTKIFADATGDTPVFNWNATSGDILGGGDTVTYISPPCTMGDNEITCTVKDKAENSLTKKITVVVY